MHARAGNCSHSLPGVLADTWQHALSSQNTLKYLGNGSGPLSFGTNGSGPLSFGTSGNGPALLIKLQQTDAA